MDPSLSRVMESTISSPLSVRQFVACLSTRFDIMDWRATETALYAFGLERLEAWYEQFRRDVFESRYGYPVHPTHQTPYTESLMDVLVHDLGASGLQERPKRSPTLCLSHDIDHLRPTLRLWLKTWISRREWLSLSDDYLSSIDQILTLDAAVSGRQGVSTVFVANPQSSGSILDRVRQWLVDPTYTVDHPLFERFLALLQKHQCTLGIHGSIDSLIKPIFEKERQSLESRCKQSIRYVRQHWLNLPGIDALNRLEAYGYRLDSTLGWNGTCGFRGGMARPFPIVLQKDRVLWEVPMILMDGPLFCDLKFGNAEALDFSCKMLEHVKAYQGCVSINWHDRACHPQLRWDVVYQQLLEWASNAGFHFANFGEIELSHVF